jgi:anti-anti-sigma factor
VFDEELEVGVIDDAHGVVVRLSGALDLASAPTLVRHLDRLDGRRPVTFDVSGVTFLDLAGLRPMLTLSSRSVVSVRNPRPIVRRLLEASGALARLPIEGPPSG